MNLWSVIRNYWHGMANLVIVDLVSESKLSVLQICEGRNNWDGAEGISSELAFSYCVKLPSADASPEVLPVQRKESSTIPLNPYIMLISLDVEVAPRKATPVSFEPLQIPPKYFMEGKALPIIDPGTYGPTKLQTSNFNSKDSQGITAWHYSQSPLDLDSPLPETPVPSKLGTIYIHRNTRDGGYQVWAWLPQGDYEKWQPIDLSGALVHHPEIPTRVLTLQASTGATNEETEIPIARAFLITWASLKRIVALPATCFLSEPWAEGGDGVVDSRFAVDFGFSEHAYISDYSNPTMNFLRFRANS
ncbi:hypothetical protein FB446DRAFT_705366 [Lentinula raphanica]|nr:hypothetical protein FB446DRAFT_705366 [Lentinula raphanica]